MTCVVFAHDLSDSGALLRFTVFGRNLSEWRVLAAWAKRYQLPNKSLRWAVQMPRIYQVTTLAVPEFVELPSSAYAAAAATHRIDPRVCARCGRAREWWTASGTC